MFKHIHMICSWVTARALPPPALDDGKGWLHRQHLTNFTLGLISPRLGKKDMAAQGLACCLWPDSTAAGALSCESSLTQTVKHLGLKYANDRVNNKKKTSKCHWNTLTRWPEPALYPLHTTSWKGQEMSRAGKGTGLSGHDCTPWSTDRQATQLLLKKSDWLMEAVYPH